MITDDLLQAVLDRLDGVRRTNSGFQARCPVHDDQHASLSVSRGEDGRILLHCHAGCPVLDICRTIGLRLSDLFSPDPHSIIRIAATYDYRDTKGQLLYQVVRFASKKKKFAQRRPDGKNSWIWNLKRTPRVLYRLPELLAASPDEWAFVVEGEKDADRLASLGLVATTCPQGAGKWNKLSDDSALHGRRIAIIADKDEAGRKHAADVAMRLSNRAREIRIIELPGQGKDASDWFDTGGTVDELIRLAESARSVSHVNARPTILIDTEEYRVVTETIAALTADPDLYQRGSVLVRVIRDCQPTDSIIRSDGCMTIQAVPPANLRERMTRFATFIKLNSKNEEVSAHPAVWLVGAVDARAGWDGIRRLKGVSDAPILRSDGSIWQQPGYDERTGVLYDPAPGTMFPPVNDKPSKDEIDVALESLLEIVCDFPFESDEHKAAWLAALFTPLARFAFIGPSPLFLIDANVRAAGKSLLAQTIGYVALGREMPVSSYVHDTDELRKKITAIAIAGDRLILWDNLTGVFANDALDRALTSTRWKDRILGRSEEVELPLIPTWFATGNNVQVASDTMRRIIHIRLDCLDEHPEERTKFKHPNLLAWIAANRGRLLIAALTILSAHLKRKQTLESLTPFGGFEGWSEVVRKAVIGVGLLDPCLTRARLVESPDTITDIYRQLIMAWQDYDLPNRGIIISDLLRTLYPSTLESMPLDDASVAMRAALENLVGCPPGRVPTARQIANRFRIFRRRVLDGVYYDIDTSQSRRSGYVWRLYAVTNS